MPEQQAKNISNLCKFSCVICPLYYCERRFVEIVLHLHYSHWNLALYYNMFLSIYIIVYITLRRKIILQAFQNLQNVCHKEVYQL